MQLADLKSKLGIVNNTVQSGQILITTGLLSENINELIKYCYDYNPILIKHAQYVSEDDTSVTVRGNSDFLNIPGLDVVARFFIDEEEPQLCLKYTLLPDVPPPGKWVFSKSFPGLPKVADNSKPVLFKRAEGTAERPQVVPLDTLVIFHAYYVVVSAPLQEPEFKVPMKWGINFAGYLRPQLWLYVVEKLFGSADRLTLYGTIRKPLATETPAELKLLYPQIPGKIAFPWVIAETLEKGLTGITLQVDLGLDCNVLDVVDFRAENLYFYTPLSEEWTLHDTSPGFYPMQAYTGSIDIKNSGIGVKVISPIEYGLDELNLIGAFEGVSLSNLSQLTGLTGSSDSPLSLLPDEIKNAGEKLGQLQLVRITLSVDYSDMDSISLSNASFTVGMPDLKWNVWPGSNGNSHFEIDSIACTFDFDDPFGSVAGDPVDQKVMVTVFGAFRIEDVPFNITASNENGFSVYAELAEPQTIPLKKILQTYAPGIPAPSDLTIDTFRVSVVPCDFYSMALLMASEPEPWTIALGPKTLKVEDVAMGVMYTKGGSVSGTVSGKISLDDIVELDIAYETPGDIIIRSYAPEISLAELIKTVTDDTLEAPDGFDLTLKNNSILFEKKESEYIFQLATMVEEFGGLAFVVEKTPEGHWGFAVGLSISTGQVSTMKGVGSFVSAFEEWFPFDQFVLAVSSIDDKTFQFPAFQKFNTRSLSGKIQLPGTVSGIQKGFYLYTSTVFTRKNKILAALIDLVKIPEATRLEVMLAYLATKKQFQLGVSLTTFLTPAKDVAKRSAQGDLAYDNTTLTGTLFLTTGGNDGFTFGLSAAVKTYIQGSKVDFTVIIYALANGFFISGTMDNKRPISFGPVQLAGLAIELGISFEGLPSVGFSASIDIQGLGQSSLAVLIDSADPAKSMIAGAISDLNLKKIVDGLLGTLDVQVPDWLDGLLAEVSISGSSYDRFTVPAANAGSVIEALDNYDAQTISSAFTTYGKLPVFPSSSDGLTLFRDTPGSQWYITSLTGTGESSLINHYELSKNSQGGVDVAKEAQFYFVPDPMGSNIGKFYYQPGMMISGELQFMFLKLDVDVECVLNKGIRVDAQLDPIVIGTEKLFSLTAAEGGGGPKVSICTYHRESEPVEAFKDPHFYINGKLVILAITRSMFISISSKGAIFDVKGDLIPYLVKGELSGSFDSYSHMKVGGNISAGIGDIDLGLLGTFKIETGVAAGVDIFVNGSEDFGADLTASFEFLGNTHSLSKLTLDVKTQDFTHLPALFFEKVKDFLVDLFNDAKKWIDAAVNYLKWGWGKIEGVLKEVFKELNPEEIKKLLSAAFSCAASTAMSWM